MLRDVRGNQVTTAEQKIENSNAAIEVLRSKVSELTDYLKRVHRGELPINQPVLEKVQNILNLSQNLTIMNEAFSIKVLLLLSLF